MAHRFPVQANEIRTNSGSYVFTIPKPVAHALELEEGMLPDEILWDDDGTRELTLKFEDTSENMNPRAD
jgi:hypothetical protein